MLKNILYILGSIVFFFAGMISYGIILNLRDITLEEAMKEKGISSVNNPVLIIDRKNYKINLYSDEVMVKSYRAVFGKNQSIVKTEKNDNVTPIGEYKICSKDTSLKFHKSLKLDYPNATDAAEALARNYINKDEYNAIMISTRNNSCPPKETKLGADIEIHGIGTYDIIFKNLPFSFNWTNGSIAVSNKSIDELYLVTKIGTHVKIIYK